MSAKKLALAAWVGVSAAAAGGPAAWGAIAITEFIHDPWGTDEQQEWIELFNYGPEPVNLAGWTMKDNSTGKYTFPDFAIPSGGYVVVARDKALFEARWLGGAADDRVLGGLTFVLNNSAPGDGIYLRDPGEALRWSVGFASPSTAYRSYWLTGDGFEVTAHGEPPQVGGGAGALIVRNGNDASGLLGYEGNEATADPHAFASAARNGDLEVEFGSPLRGGYAAQAGASVPEPAAIAVSAVAGVAMLGRRRRRG